LVSLLGTLVERTQHRGCPFARGRLAFDGNQIAAHRDLDAELMLEPHEVAAVAAGQRRQVRVALEFESHSLARRIVRLVGARGVHTLRAGTEGDCAPGQSSSGNTPFRLFAYAAAMRTRLMLPINAIAPSTCTGCR